MKYQIYEFFNRKIDAYERPIFRLEDEADMCQAVTRDFRASDEASKVKMKEYTLIHIGVYDDTNGKIILIEPNSVLDLGTLGDADGNDK